MSSRAGQIDCRTHTRLQQKNLNVVTHNPFFSQVLTGPLYKKLHKIQRNTKSPVVPSRLESDERHQRGKKQSENEKG